MKAIDQYLRKFRVRTSGIRNKLWGILTLGLMGAQVSHKIEVVDVNGEVHELYREYRLIHKFPWKKFYSIRFNVRIPKNINPPPARITLWRMSPGNPCWDLMNGMNLHTGYVFRNGKSDSYDHVPENRWITLHDTFRYDEITAAED